MPENKPWHLKDSALHTTSIGRDTPEAKFRNFFENKALVLKTYTPDFFMSWEEERSFDNRIVDLTLSEVDNF